MSASFELTAGSHVRVHRHVAIRLVLLVFLFAGCATNTQPTAEVGNKPRVKQRDFAIIITKENQTHYFDNRHPHCLAYRLPGEWIHGMQEAAIVTPDRRHFIGVALINTTPGQSDTNEVSRIVSMLQKDTEKDWGHVPSRTTPFPAKRPGAVLLEFETVVVTPEAAARALGPDKPKVGQEARIHRRVVAPLIPGVIMIVTVQDVNDAREVLDTIEVTENPRCWEQTIRERFPGVL
jgi:hypothetical protein